MTKPKVIAITGCTASGKSALALELAQRLSGEIVCMDSMQVYRGMDIGTAKPTREEQSRAPHHMLDVAEPTQAFGVAEYVAGAERAFQDIWSRGRLPILTGGTGLYLKSLLYGMALGTEKSDPAIRAEYEAMAARPGGKRALHQLLQQVDGESAARLHENDLRRVIRALEVYRLTGKPIGRQETRRPERPYVIMPFALRVSRDALQERIQGRVRRMLAEGLLEEVRALLAGGVPLQAQSMQAIGYKELAPVCLGQESLSRATERLILNTRHYAKRQETWFKGEKALRWLEAGESALGAAEALSRVFLQREPEA